MRLIEVRIEDVAFGGKGVAREQGKAVFIPFTIDGELVRAEVSREKKNFAQAAVTEILEPSSHRVEPPCPYFGPCGGCSYQHMEYGHQLEVKTRQVAEILKRIGGLADAPVRAIVPSPRPYEYRNRVTVHVDRGVIGYFRRDEHRLIDVERCPIAEPEVNRSLAELRASRPRDGHYTLRARSGPRVFSQTNDAVSEELIDYLAQLLPERRTLLVDAYCGSGFFCKRLRGNFARVIGIDWDIHAIHAAQNSAAPEEEYRAGNIEELLEKILGAAEPESTAIIVDPPAVGLSARVREVLRDFAPNELIYVSCNPPTLARDLATWKDHLELQSVTPFDMFPQTAEIEAVAYLRRSASALPQANAN